MLNGAYGGAALNVAPAAAVSPPLLPYGGAPAAPYGAPPPPLPPAAPPANAPTGTPSRVLRLSNMVTAAELATEYDDIYADVKEQLDTMGTVTNLFIPRRGDFVGFIYASFATQEQAEGAARQLCRLSFAQKAVLVAFENEGTLAAVAATSA